MREYVEVATEERDEERSWVGYCPRCEWIISEEEAQQRLRRTKMKPVKNTFSGAS